jgi:hypothetical protein
MRGIAGGMNESRPAKGALPRQFLIQNNTLRILAGNALHILLQTSNHSLVADRCEFHVIRDG